MSPTSNLARGLTRGLTGLALGLLLAAFQAAENPLAPPDTALRRRSASIVDTKVPRRTDGVDATSQEALLRPELTFLRTKRPLQLATLAKALTDDAAERAAVTTLLEQGAAAVRVELAAEGAEHDLGAATTLAVSELWQLCAFR